MNEETLFEKFFTDIENVQVENQDLVNLVYAQSQKVDELSNLLRSKNPQLEEIVTKIIENPEASHGSLVQIKTFLNATKLQKVFQKIGANFIATDNEFCSYLFNDKKHRRVGFDWSNSMNDSLDNLIELDDIPNFAEDKNLLDQLIWICEYKIISTAMRPQFDLANKVLLQLLNGMPTPPVPIQIMIAPRAGKSKSSFNFLKGKPTLIFYCDDNLTEHFVTYGINGIERIRAMAEYMHELAHAYLEIYLHDIESFRVASKYYRYTLLSALRESLPVLITLNAFAYLRNYSVNPNNSLITEILTKDLKRVMKLYHNLDIYSNAYKIVRNLRRVKADDLLKWVRKIDFIKISHINLSDKESRDIVANPYELMPLIERTHEQ